jgi:uncharacterized protein (TIGR02001 family)
MVRIAALFALFSASTALAADDMSQEAIQSKFDLAFGAAIASNYIFRGVTQSNDKPAFQAYMEASYGMFYAGLWGSTVDFEDDNKGELDITVGVRPEFGNLTLDIGYVRYLYTADGDCCGEAFAKADYAINDTFGIGAEVFHDFEAETTYLRGHGSVALPAEFEFSGGIGTYAQFTQLDWDAGVSRTFADAVTLDLRYHGYDDDVDTTHKFAASLSFDTSLSSLRGN